MDKQISLSYLSDELAQVRTKKKEFLERIEQIIPWEEWETMIQPYYYKGERGNKPYTYLYDVKDAAFPQRRYQTPEEYGRMATFLISPANGCMSGQAFIFDGAMTTSY